MSTKSRWLTENCNELCCFRKLIAGTCIPNNHHPTQTDCRQVAEGCRSNHKCRQTANTLVDLTWLLTGCILVTFVYKIKYVWFYSLINVLQQIRRYWWRQFWIPDWNLRGSGWTLNFAECFSVVCCIKSVHVRMDDWRLQIKSTYKYK